jgi:hypothetical protein
MNTVEAVVTQILDVRPYRILVSSPALNLSRLIRLWVALRVMSSNTSQKTLMVTLWTVRAIMKVDDL